MTRRFLQASFLSALFLSNIAGFLIPNCLGQTVSSPPQTSTYPIIQTAAVPFDKLELFAFFAAGPTNSYAIHVIQERGTDFTPDASFISSFPFAEKQTILKSIKPRVPHSPSPDRDQAYNLTYKANEAQRNRQFVSAAEIYQQAIQLAPNSATLHSAYAGVLLLSHNYTASDEQSHLCLKLWPQDADAHAMLALSMTFQKRHSEAEIESREALRIYSQHASALFTLSNSLINQRKYKEAIPVVREAMVTLPKMTALTKFLGLALLETGELAAGTDQLSSYVKLSPDDAEGHYYYGVALRMKGSSAEAHLQFSEALRLQPNNAMFEAATHPESTPSPTDSALVPNPEDGSVSGNIYTNNFFAFTYEFPKDWGVLSSDAARSTVEIGGLLMSTGDPVEQDLKRAAAKHAHPLLYVMQPHVANQPLAMKAILISAFDIRNTPEVTAETYIKGIDQRARQSGVAMDASGSSKELLIDSRSFWKLNLMVRTAAGASYETQIARAEKGYMLLVLLIGPDLASVNELENSLQSFHFLSEPK
jgi:tetratricopeptide (TPR) repeat protein